MDEGQIDGRTQDKNIVSNIGFGNLRLQKFRAHLCLYLLYVNVSAV